MLIFMGLCTTVCPCLPYFLSFTLSFFLPLICTFYLSCFTIRLCGYVFLNHLVNELFNCCLIDWVFCFVVVLLLFVYFLSCRTNTPILQ